MAGTDPSDTAPESAADLRLDGKQGLRRLLAVLGVGEVVMLGAAALGALLLLLYLGRVLEGGPAVITPAPRAHVTATARS